jgi:hypothetical protein
MWEPAPRANGFRLHDLYRNGSAPADEVALVYSEMQLVMNRFAMS